MELCVSLCLEREDELNDVSTMRNGYQPMWSVDFWLWEVVLMATKWKEEEEKFSIALYNAYPMSRSPHPWFI